MDHKSRSMLPRPLDSVGYPSKNPDRLLLYLRVSMKTVCLRDTQKASFHDDLIVTPLLMICS